jgi:hypothetical protein
MNDFGAVSRRALLGRVGLGAAAVTLALTRPAPAQQQKVSKTEAKYQEQPKGLQRCEICVNFRPPDQCQFVEGPINKRGWCQFFAAKEGAQ